MGVGRAVARAVLNSSWSGNADHLRAVRGAIRDIDRRPSCAGAGSSPHEPLITIHQGRGDGGEAAGVAQNPAHKPAAELRKTVFRALIQEKVPAAVRIRQTEMIMS